jgi:hypothetical protein
MADEEPQLLETVYEILTTPPDIPVTNPATTVASAFSALQVPPGAKSVSMTVVPWHKLPGPDILPAVR